MTVADLSIMEAEVMVDETDIRDLEVGQKAVVMVDALEDLEIEGEITEIGASAIVRGTDTSQAQAQLGANTGNQPKDFKVKIVLKDPPTNMRPGLNASADITTATREGVLAVPIQAVVVREVDDEGNVVQAGAAAEEGEATSGKRGEEKDGVFVPLFGQEACTTAGPAALALKTGAAVIPGFLVPREKKGHYYMRFKPAIEIQVSDDRDADVVRNTAAFNQHIEDLIREYPQCWLWGHRRFRTRKSGPDPYS
jgi:hypothetical protein